MSPQTEQFRFVTDRPAAEEALRQLGEAKSIFFDSETTGLDPHTAKLRLLQMRSSTSETFVVDCNKVNPLVFKDLLQSKTLVGQNIKFDAKFLMAAGIQPTSLWDTMIAHQIYTAGFPEVRHNLKAILDNVLGVSISKEMQVSDWSQAELSDEQLAYAAADVEHLHQLAQTLRGMCLAEGLLETVRLDMQTIVPCAWMELQGLRLDLGRSDQIRSRLLALLEDSRQACGKLAGDPAFNPQSPKQVRTFFHQWKKYQAFESFDAEALSRIPHPMAKEILAFRRLAKMLGSYLDKFPVLVNAHTGNLHCDVNINPTATGRMSTRNMSLQNVPARGEIGTLMRSIFTCDPGKVCVVADYSQIELRVMAMLSRDPQMQQAYAEGIDIHDLTTQEVFNTTKDDPEWGDKRRVGKMMNFAIPYGISGMNLSRKSDGLLNQKQADALIEGWYRTYKGVFRLFDEVSSHAIRHRESRTLLGRRRSYPVDGRSAGSVQRQAQNHVIQGTAADFNKAAIVEAWKLGLDLRLTVHDELQVYADKDNADQACHLLEQAMVKGAERIMSHGEGRISPIPVEADAHYGSDWAAAKAA